MAMLSLEGMITVAEAARRLNRSIEQVRRYLREGKLRGQRIGGQWFIEESQLTRMTDRRARYEQQMDVLRRISENREAIYLESGRLFDGAEAVREVRRERLKEFDRDLPRRKPGHRPPPAQ
jgi:excisionase family DNA binding protein